MRGHGGSPVRGDLAPSDERSGNQMAQVAMGQRAKEVKGTVEGMAPQPLGCTDAIGSALAPLTPMYMSWAARYVQGLGYLLRASSLRLDDSMTAMTGSSSYRKVPSLPSLLSLNCPSAMRSRKMVLAVAERCVE